MKFVIASGLLISLIGCGGAINHNATTSSLSSSNGSSPGSAPPAEPVTDTSFFVHMYNQDYFPYYLNKAGAAWGTDCLIPSSATSQDIICILDIPEGDVYSYPFSLNYNVPPSMCAYHRFTPYWYFNSEVGFGPQSVAVTINENASGVVTSVDCTIDGVPYTPCTPPELSVDQLTGGFSCIYDQTKNIYPGPNCCFGIYDEAITTVTPSGATTTTSYNQQWNSNTTGIESCLGGQVRNNWPNFTWRGLPESLLTETEDTGLNAFLTMRPPVNVPNGVSNVAVSNYYGNVMTPFNGNTFNGGDTDHTHTGYVVARTSTLPYAVDPVDDRSGSNMETTDPSMPLVGQDSYMFECLDHGFEVINRIRVYIRPWNTLADFLAYGTSNGVTYNPNVTGPAGTNCTGVHSGEDCQNKTKWDDALFTGPYTAPNRATYFPNELYQ